ncbi:MAG: hypothetical protein E7262_04020 [Lachnospiraceae bacterium]|nr:hypothetical protein [Lachnospiraceae bacterium]
MGKVNKKYVGLVACVVAVLCSVALCIGIFAKADNANTDSQVQVNYEDYYYCNSELIDVENPVVQNIYENYENSDLSLASDESSITYTVNSEDASMIDGVSSALCMSMDPAMGIDTEVLLYLGDKEDCTYNETTGLASSEFDGNWLLLNGTQPLAMYNEDVREDGSKSYYTPAFINDEDFASNILITVDASNNVSVVGRIVDKDIEGNLLEEIQVESLNIGDALCPAYVNYNYSVLNIADSVVEATEIYNNNAYLYGSSYELSVGPLPNNSYLYSMRTSYKEDSNTELEENKFGFFTKPKEISVEASQIIKAVEPQFAHDSLAGYDYMNCFDFLKQVWKHKQANSKEELRVTYEHKINGVQKGYISTWNSLTINKALRTDAFDTLDAEDKLTTNTLTTMCKKISSTNNYLMLRKVSADYLTNVFGIKSLDGEMLTDEMVKGYSDSEISQLESNLQSIVGYTMVEKGFMSASMMPLANIIFGRTVEIIIKVPAGSQYYVSHNIIESEAIFPPNTKLTVESVKYDDSKGKYIIIANLSQD